jgi:hypothetical protein
MKDLPSDVKNKSSRAFSGREIRKLKEKRKESEDARLSSAE